MTCGATFTSPTWPNRTKTARRFRRGKTASIAQATTPAFYGSSQTTTFIPPCPLSAALRRPTLSPAKNRPRKPQRFGMNVTKETGHFFLRDSGRKSWARRPPPAHRPAGAASRSRSASTCRTMAAIRASAPDQTTDAPGPGQRLKLCKAAPRRSAQRPRRTTKTPAGTLQKIPPEAAASGGEIIFSRLVAKSAAAWHIGYKSKKEARKEITK